LNDKKKVTRRIMLAGCVAALGIVLVALLRPDFRELWEDRMFHHDVEGHLDRDLTLLTRVAEANGMLEIINSQPLNYFIGMGYGHAYYWSGDALNELYSTGMAFEEYRGDIWFSGHNMWIYALFSSGIVGLGMCFSFVVGVVMRGMRMITVDVAPETLFYRIAALLAFVSFMAQSFVSNPFGERFACILIGIISAVITFPEVALSPRRALRGVR
jgi:O-antigen ligase